MKISSLRLVCGAALALGALTLPAVLQARAEKVVRPDAYADFDVRDGIRGALGPTAAQRADLASLEPIRAPLDLRYGVPRELIRYGGYLTRPSKADPEATARRFLAEHAELYRVDPASLVVAKRYRTRHNGATHVFFSQVDAGRAVYGSRLGFTIDRRGRIVIAAGTLVPGARAAGIPALRAEDAVQRAAAGVGVHVADLSALSENAQRSVFRNTVASGIRKPSRLTAELVTFPMPNGQPARLAWKTVTEVSETGWYESVVDARTGELLHRENYYDHAGPQGTVFTAQHPGVPAATRSVQSFGGWGISGRVTTSNNVVAYQDLTDADALGYQPETPDAPDPGFQHFDYTWNDSWNANGMAASLMPAGPTGYNDADPTIVQMFYYTNVMHDYLYGLGFDEASGNFQTNNFGLGGSGGDPVNAESQDGWEDGVALNCVDDGNPIQCVNNANFGTPADGSSPRMQMFMWTTPFRDGAMDGDVIAHEYGHGVSNRLVGGGSLGSGTQTGAMGEGWSDFISVSKWDDNKVGEYVTGNNTTGIRPFAFDNSPLVYTDLCNVNNTGACQVHRDGQIWVATLYDMRTALVDRYGNSGKTEAIQLVIDGMKATGSSPSYLNARDGILAADVTTNGGANQCLIWGAFAGREMGPGATSSGDQMTVTADTTGPASCTPVADIGGPYSTQEGTDEPLDAGASVANVDAAGDATLTYEWDFDADGQFDDATGEEPDFDLVGQDGVYPIAVRVTNENGFFDTDSGSVTVTNVAPSVTIASDAPKPENSAVTVDGVISDPGWLEALTATIDWGDGVQALVGVVENNRPDATLTYSASHTYGDNGTFTVTVCGIDDDTSTCESIPVEVTNVNPTAVIDETGSVLVNGVPTFIANVGDPLTFNGSSEDPGSDDLTLSWNWDDGPPAPDVTVLSLVNPPGADPFPSPSIQPRSVGDSQVHAFTLACMYDVGFSVLDDDGGSASDLVKVLIGGNAELARSAGYWQNAYRDRNNNVFSTQELQCFLAIAGFVSNVFDEVRSAATIAEARDVLTAAGSDGDPRVQLDRQLLAALLNFANGAVGYAELVDTDGDGTADTAFSAAIAAAEAVRLDPSASDAALVAAKDVLERINLMDA